MKFGNILKKNIFLNQFLKFSILVNTNYALLLICWHSDSLSLKADIEDKQSHLRQNLVILWISVCHLISCEERQNLFIIILRTSIF